MAYLYLNFLDNLEKGSRSWDDFYTTSLTEQYDVLKRKLGRYAPDTLQELIAACCPSAYHTYYVSMPSFERKITTDRRGKECIYNIVIRPEKSAYSTNYIPSKYDLIFIGDFHFTDTTYFLFSFDWWLYRKKSAPWNEIRNTRDFSREKTLLQTLHEKPFMQCFFFFLDGLPFSDFLLFRRKRKVRQRRLGYVSIGHRRNCKSFGFVGKMSGRRF